MTEFWTKDNRKHTKWSFFWCGLLCILRTRAHTHTQSVYLELICACMSNNYTDTLREASTLIELWKQLPNDGCQKLCNPESEGNPQKMHDNFPIKVKPLEKGTSIDSVMKWNCTCCSKQSKLKGREFFNIFPLLKKGCYVLLPLQQASFSRRGCRWITDWGGELSVHMANLFSVCTNNLIMPCRNDNLVQDMASWESGLNFSHWGSMKVYPTQHKRSYTVFQRASGLIHMNILGLPLWLPATGHLAGEDPPPPNRDVMCKIPDVISSPGNYVITPGTLCGSTIAIEANSMVFLP